MNKPSVFEKNEGIVELLKMQTKHEIEIFNSAEKIEKICGTNRDDVDKAARSEQARMMKKLSISLKEVCTPKELEILENLPSETSKRALYLDRRYNGAVWLEINGRKIGGTIEDILKEAELLANKHFLPELGRIIEQARREFKIYISKKLTN